MEHECIVKTLKHNHFELRMQKNNDQIVKLKSNYHALSTELQYVSLPCEHMHIF